MIQLRRFRWLASLVLWLGLMIGASSQPIAADVMVWLNTNSGVYHCPGGQYYGNTKKGKFLSEREAASQGYRAAYGRYVSESEAIETGNRPAYGARC